MTLLQGIDIYRSHPVSVANIQSELSQGANVTVCWPCDREPFNRSFKAMMDFKRKYRMFQQTGIWAVPLSPDKIQLNSEYGKFNAIGFDPAMNSKYGKFGTLNR